MTQVKVVLAVSVVSEGPLVCVACVVPVVSVVCVVPVSVVAVVCVVDARLGFATLSLSSLVRALLIYVFNFIVNYKLKFQQ